MKNYYENVPENREDNFGKFIKIIILVLAGAFLLKWAITSGYFFKDSLDGDGYTMNSPPGWERVEKEKIKRLEDENTSIVAYVTKEKEIYTERPYAQIAVYSIKLPRNMWMEDEYPTILSAIKNSGLKLVDHGELKINDMLFKWVLVDNEEDDIISLQFFHIPENKKFYKIIYSSSARHFNSYRPVFESVKDTFKLKFAF